MKFTMFLAAASIAAVLVPFVPAQAAQDEAAVEAVIVTATRQAQRAADALASVEVLEREDIERAGHASLIEVLQALPGLRVSSNGGPGANANVFIRGAESRHTLLLIDGLRVGSATSGAPSLENIPLGMIERIEILRGPASALYGSEAIGGVIQIFTRRGQRGFQPEVFVGYGTNATRKAALTLAGGVERLRYSLSAGRERTDGFRSKTDPDYWRSSPTRTSYWDDDDGYRNDHISGSLSLGFRARDEIGLTFMRSEGRNRYDASATSYFDSYMDKKSSMSGVHLRNELLPGWSSTLRVGQSEEDALNRASAAAPSRFRTRQEQLAWQHDVALPLGSLLAAYERVNSKVDSTTNYDRTTRRVDSVLLGWSAKVGAHHLQLNARHDDNSQFGDKTTGLLAYGYDITPAWRVRGSVATAFNAPTFNQLYWPMTTVTSYHGNPDLKPERALNRELGLRWSGTLQSVELTYFDNRVKDLIASNPVHALRGQQVNVAEARMKGAELAYYLSLDTVTLAAGVDYLDARNEQTGERLPRRAARAGFVRLSHSAGRLDWGMELNGAGRRYDDARNATELHGYGLLGAHVHYRLATDWRLEARADNILDKRYELARGYRTPGRTVFVGLRYAPR
jgi:vitamin B12 transporter